MAKKKIKEAVEAVETKVEQIVEDVKSEANEEAGTVTLKKWEVLAIAATVTLLAILVIL